MIHAYKDMYCIYGYHRGLFDFQEAKLSVYPLKCAACRGVVLITLTQAFSVSHAATGTIRFRWRLRVQIDVSKDRGHRRDEQRPGDIDRPSLDHHWTENKCVVWVGCPAIRRDRSHTRRCQRLILTPFCWRANKYNAHLLVSNIILWQSSDNTRYNDWKLHTIDIIKIIVRVIIIIIIITIIINFSNFWNSRDLICKLITLVIFTEVWKIPIYRMSKAKQSPFANRQCIMPKLNESDLRTVLIWNSYSHRIWPNHRSAE